MFSLLPVALKLSALWRLSQGLAFEVCFFCCYYNLSRANTSREVWAGRLAVTKKMAFLPENQSSGCGSQALASKEVVSAEFWQPACLSN